MVLVSTFMFNKRVEFSNMIESVIEPLICIKHVKGNDHENIVKGLVFGSAFIATMLLVIFWYIRFQGSVVMNS